MLAFRGCEDAANLTDKLVLRPETTGMIEEVLHLARHVAKPSRRANYDGIVVGKLPGLSDRRGLVQLVTSLAGNLFRYEFRNALDDRVRGRVAGPQGDRLSHPLDVTVRRVVEHKNAYHGLPSIVPLLDATARQPSRPLMCNAWQLDQMNDAVEGQYGSV